MGVETRATDRKFTYNGLHLPDPDPKLTPEQVRDAYSATYPEITTAAIEGPEAPGGTLRFTANWPSSRGSRIAISCWRNLTYVQKRANSPSFSDRRWPRRGATCATERPPTRCPCLPAWYTRVNRHGWVQALLYLAFESISAASRRGLDLPMPRSSRRI